MKGQGLHHARAHLKTSRLVVGLVHASNLKVPMFLSRLNETIGEAMRRLYQFCHTEEEEAEAMPYKLITERMFNL